MCVAKEHVAPGAFTLGARPLTLSSPTPFPFLRSSDVPRDVGSGLSVSPISKARSVEALHLLKPSATTGGAPKAGSGASSPLSRRRGGSGRASPALPMEGKPKLARAFSNI